MANTFNFSNRIAHRAGEQGARDTVDSQAVLDKSATGDKHHLLKLCFRFIFQCKYVEFSNQDGRITSCAEQQGIDVI